MGKYSINGKLNTYKDVIDGKISYFNNRDCFSLSEWAKIEAHLKRVKEELISEEFDKISKSYEIGLKESSEKEYYIKSYFEELDAAINNDFQNRRFSPEFDQLMTHFVELLEKNKLEFYLPIDNSEISELARNRAKTLAYIRLHNMIKKELNIDQNNEEKPTIKGGLTYNQQVLLIHYLEKAEFLNLPRHKIKISDIGTIISKLISRDQSNLRTDLNEIHAHKNKRKYYSLKNLYAVLPLVELLENEELIDEIKEKIKLEEIKKI